MKCYIATKFENTEGFNKMKSILEAAGHEITIDWTKEDASKVPEAEREEYIAKCAASDVIGVYMADAVIFLATPEKSAGAFVELGLGIGFWKRVIIVGAFGNDIPDCIFYHLPRLDAIHEHVSTMEEVPAILEKKLPPLSPIAQEVVRQMQEEDAEKLNGNN